MADNALLFREGRRKVADLARGLTDEELALAVPATRGWTIRDIIGHLAGDSACFIAGDFPNAYFANFGDPSVVGVLNDWTAAQVSNRKYLSLEEVLSEWEHSATTIEKMMASEQAWPEQIPRFADRILLTDLGVHQQDVYGALGLVKDRDDPLVRMATAGYIASMGFRLSAVDLPPLEVTAGDSVRQTHPGTVGARVAGSRFELFRALSGRRNPDQVRALDWDGDPEPYIRYVYPYGIREEPLVEP